MLLIETPNSLTLLHKIIIEGKKKKISFHLILYSTIINLINALYNSACFYD